MSTAVYSPYLIYYFPWIVAIQPIAIQVTGLLLDDVSWLSQAGV